MVFVKKLSNLSKADYSRMLSDAEVYNKTLDQGVIPDLNLTGEAKEVYNKLLDVTGSAIMAFVEIPKLNTTLPIYHGTDDSVLQVAIGHIPGTSLPIGVRGPTQLFLVTVVCHLQSYLRIWINWWKEISFIFRFWIKH